MKRCIASVIVALSLLSVVQATSAETIKIGFHQLKPHAYKDETSSEVKGSVVAYVNEVAAQMGYEVEWVGPLPFARLLAYCKDGTLDGAAPVVENPAWAQEIFYYPDWVVWHPRSALAVTKDNPLDKIESIDDVKGYTLGTIRDVAPSKFISDNMDQFRIEALSGETWLQQNLEKLLAGRLDAVYNLNTASIRFVVKTLGIEDQIKILFLPEPPQNAYVVFSQQSDKGKILLEKYNEAAQQLQLDYEDFVQKELDAAGH